jgi:hypothetical protein
MVEGIIMGVAVMGGYRLRQVRFWAVLWLDP